MSRSELLTVLCILFCAIFLEFANGAKKTWIHDSNIANSQNWEGEGPSKNCKGTYFAPDNTAPVLIDKLFTSELVLPLTGEIDLMDGGYIHFAEENPKCIKLKPQNYYDWYDYRNWKQETVNSAIPHKERTPCVQDEVFFPAAIQSRVDIRENFGVGVRVGALKFGTEYLTSSDFLDFSTSGLGRQVFHSRFDHFTLRIGQQKCESQGCLCQDAPFSCPPLPEWFEVAVPCDDPIQPEGFCHKICGASFTLKPADGFNLDSFRDLLREYTVDTHASRVIDFMGNDVIQVVFSEKEFTEKSIRQAEEFFATLKSDPGQFKVLGLILEKSGAYRSSQSSTSTVAGLIFGTLAAVAALFALLFYVYEDRKHNFWPRSTSVFAPLMLARFNNRDGNLIIDGQSLAGSVISLQRSFDNPMYGTVDDDQASVVSLRDPHENPMYDIALKTNAPTGQEGTEQ